MCTYVKNSNEPCKICPRRMTALHMCKLLQEIKQEAKNNLS